ncbi:hypothetical protein B9479_007862 [Cryptococcus floricola]|uniref:Uncharacterized protein n=1 Tax=Cryptococcus floricola TaxID=2591691 RepID=A0A5D3AJ54_9TREE|nr:hypothetical protein B9479_007862 [Cryptococcus floricola]
MAKPPPPGRRPEPIPAFPWGTDPRPPRLPALERFIRTAWVLCSYCRDPDHEVEACTKKPCEPPRTTSPLPSLTAADRPTCAEFSTLCISSASLSSAPVINHTTLAVRVAVRTRAHYSTSQDGSKFALSPQSSPRLSEHSLDLPDGLQTMSASPFPPPLQAQHPSIRHEIHSFHPISNYALDVQDDIINGSPLRDADLDCYIFSFAETLTPSQEAQLASQSAALGKRETTIGLTPNSSGRNWLEPIRITRVPGLWRTIGATHIAETKIDPARHGEVREMLENAYNRYASSMPPTSSVTVPIVTPDIDAADEGQRLQPTTAPRSRAQKTPRTGKVANLNLPPVMCDPSYRLNKTAKRDGIPAYDDIDLIRSLAVLVVGYGLQPVDITNEQLELVSEGKRGTSFPYYFHRKVWSDANKDRTWGFTTTYMSNALIDTELPIPMSYFDPTLRLTVASFILALRRYQLSQSKVPHGHPSWEQATVKPEQFTEITSSDLASAPSTNPLVTVRWLPTRSPRTLRLPPRPTIRSLSRFGPKLSPSRSPMIVSHATPLALNLTVSLLTRPFKVPIQVNGVFGNGRVHEYGSLDLGHGIKLDNVLLAPAIGANLLSVKQMTASHPQGTWHLNGKAVFKDNATSSLKLNKGQTTRPSTAAQNDFAKFVPSTFLNPNILAYAGQLEEGTQGLAIIAAKGNDSACFGDWKAKDGGVGKGIFNGLEDTGLIGSPSARQYFLTWQSWYEVLTRFFRVQKRLKEQLKEKEEQLAERINKKQESIKRYYESQGYSFFASSADHSDEMPSSTKKDG